MSTETKQRRRRGRRISPKRLEEIREKRMALAELSAAIKLAMKGGRFEGNLNPHEE